MKNLKIDNCMKCDSVKNTATWKEINKKIYYSKTWTCLRKNRKIETVDIINTHDDNWHKTIPQEPYSKIPEWCPLEDC